MDRGYAFLCFLLVLAASAQSGLAQSFGSVTVFNSADGTMLKTRTTYLTSGGHSSDPAPIPFPQGTEFSYEIQNGDEFVYTFYQLITPSGDQLTADPEEWSSIPSRYVHCMPDCFIVIDNNGFSQASSAHGQLQYYWGWTHNKL